tara:strand:+ start:224 stop:364 length:141 start_codon:yes stop_codon:yes gene_type:complete
MQTVSPAITIALTLSIILIALTGFAVFTAFGPKSRKLSDPWDNHED